MILDLAALGRLIPIGIGRHHQEVVVLDYNIGVGVPGGVGIVDRNRLIAYLTTQLGWHDPPDELLVMRLEAASPGL